MANEHTLSPMAESGQAAVAVGIIMDRRHHHQLAARQDRLLPVLFAGMRAPLPRPPGLPLGFFLPFHPIPPCLRTPPQRPDNQPETTTIQRLSAPTCCFLIWA